MFTKEATFTFKQSSKIGVQEWTHLEGGPEDTLLTYLCDEKGCNPLEARHGAAERVRNENRQ